MKNLRSLNTGTKMKIVRYLFISLIAVAFVFSGCSKSEDYGKHEHELIKQKDYWTCTMHPQVHMDKPGVCPICGMDLIKKVADENEQPAGDKDMNNMIALGNKKQILANVTTIIVKKENLQEQVTAYSYLDFVENNRKTISARFNGRIEKLFVDKTGDYIKKGQPLFEIYSPDLVQAQNEYLIALNNSSNSTSLLKASKKKLEIFGLTPEQIQTLEKTREISMTLTYFSSLSGTVIEKKVQEGVYVNEGNAIYEVAELSTLWNVAELYESNLFNVKVGNAVKLHLRAYPGEEFNGRVTFIYPVVNSQTRTIKVRSEFSSYGGKLKPQMYGETIFSADAGTGILIPADAVIFTGNRNVVWVKTSVEMFEARIVQLGQKFGEKYQILSGLNEGDEVAATGGFLIDSESQLKTGMPTGHQHGDGTTPVEQKSSSDNMEGMNMQK